ncbi:MAG: hypothetical protein INR62_09200, partial [Rhodospirillales bacterium]|nr:hypothetical protein [Acetobacter sp.]
LRSSLDYGRGYWTPPLSPRQAYRLEEKQINRRLGLPALVSLTDHDNLEAPKLLRLLPRFAETPLSVEWSVPFGPTFFHVGVHHLPPAQAADVMSRLAAYTAMPSNAALHDCLDMLHAISQVLLVLNHPLWDEKPVGMTEHRRTLFALLEFAGSRLHALEVNGLRSAAENRLVVQLGDERGLPVVAGGDRHGCEPNAILNLSRCGCMDEFVQEIRTERTSHIVYMPQYREALAWRTMQTVLDILRDHPKNIEGRRIWMERVFYRQADGTSMPLSTLWADRAVPPIMSAITGAIRLAQWRGVHYALKTLLRLQAHSGAASF